MAHSLSVRGKAYSLRSAGYSYTYIASKTGVSKATLSDWLSYIPYTPNAHTRELIGKARAAAGEKHALLKRESQERARREARELVKDISRRDLFMFGLGLYLGEGNKTHGLTRIVNSSPDVIRVAITWFSELGVRKSQFFLTMHLYPDSDIESCRAY